MHNVRCCLCSYLDLTEENDVFALDETWYFFLEVFNVSRIDIRTTGVVKDNVDVKDHLPAKR